MVSVHGDAAGHFKASFSFEADCDGHSDVGAALREKR